MVVYLANSAIFTYILLVFIGILLSLGYLLSPADGIQPIVSITDRIEGFLGFLVFSLIINTLIKSRNDLKEANNLANKRAEELAQANKELEAFSYSASHDLRAPLRGIVGFCEILLQDYGVVLDANGRDYLERISKSAIKIQNLTEDLLSLSKIGRKEMHIEETDISQIATSVLTDLAGTQPERNVSWKVQEGLKATADKGLLEIALSNLLRNSWKFTGKSDRPEIEVGSGIMADQRVFYVRDNGIGFNMKHADKLFTAFQRLHPESEFSGTGIGLAIVERVITRHNGKIWAESQIGSGSTFYFTIGGPPDS
jgi:light-regulated signal transduction histidine kinase (bacteriophytochrome)